MGIGLRACVASIAVTVRAGEEADLSGLDERVVEPWATAQRTRQKAGETPAPTGPEV